MDKAFPACRDSYAQYRKCFSAQSWLWGRANGEVDDECEEAFENFRDCVNAAVAAKKQDRRDFSS